MPDLLHGRLITDGEGHLYIHPVDSEGKELLSLHKLDERGDAIEDLIDNLVEVRYDKEAGGYIAVTDGVSHNDKHHSGEIQTISGTSGPLFDEKGNRVYDGDPHHLAPLDDDPHKNGLTFLPDEIAPRATGHTESVVAE